MARGPPTWPRFQWQPLQWAHQDLVLFCGAGPCPVFFSFTEKCPKLMAGHGPGPTGPFFRSALKSMERRVGSAGQGVGDIRRYSSAARILLPEISGEYRDAILLTASLRPPPGGLWFNSYW